MRVITEHTYGNHIFMRLEIDGKEYEISNYCGADCSWDHFRTTADGTPEREKVIAAFKELY